LGKRGLPILDLRIFPLFFMSDYYRILHGFFSENKRITGEQEFLIKISRSLLERDNGLLTKFLVRKIDVETSSF
jgi:hypothetical protein